MINLRQYKGPKIKIEQQEPIIKKDSLQLRYELVRGINDDNIYDMCHEIELNGGLDHDFIEFIAEKDLEDEPFMV